MGEKLWNQGAWSVNGYTNVIYQRHAKEKQQ